MGCANGALYRFGDELEEWHKHDALALAGRVRVKGVAAKEVSAQASEAVGRLDPLIEAVLERDLIRLKIGLSTWAGAGPWRPILK